MHNLQPFDELLELGLFGEFPVEVSLLCFVAADCVGQLSLGGVQLLFDVTQLGDGALALGPLRLGEQLELFGGFALQAHLVAVAVLQSGQLLHGALPLLGHGLVGGDHFAAALLQLADVRRLPPDEARQLLRRGRVEVDGDRRRRLGRPASWRCRWRR